MATEPWGCMEPIDTSTIQIADLLTDADIEKAKTRLEELEEIGFACGWFYVPGDDDLIHDVKIHLSWSV